jgi:uncharacterized MAPEG superfamily protein
MNFANTAYLAFYLYLLLLLLQWGVATFSKAKLPNAIPGKLDTQLSHDSFVFRASRTFANSLENSALFVGTTLFAFSINFQSVFFTLCIWIYLVARVVHMFLYYNIATEENPSPRTYFFLIGLLANIVMLLLLGAQFLV